MSYTINPPFHGVALATRGHQLRTPILGRGIGAVMFVPIVLWRLEEIERKWLRGTGRCVPNADKDLAILILNHTTANQVVPYQHPEDDGRTQLAIAGVIAGAAQYQGNFRSVCRMPI